MSVQTCDVRVRVNKQDGTPDEGARVTATLNRYDIDDADGFVGPTDVEGETDAAGEVILALWPNALGSNESTYTIRIEGTNGKPLTVTAVVPDTPSIDLEDIANLPPYPGRAPGDTAAAVAGGYAAAADASADAAAASATAAATSATAAATSATAAATSATAAATSATAAAGSATSAATSLSTMNSTLAAAVASATSAAAASATAADASADAAAVSADEAEAALAQLTATLNPSVTLYSGNGVQTVFTLASDPGSVNNTRVHIGGVYQFRSSYSVVGTALTFSSAPPAGTNNIEIEIGTVAQVELGIVTANSTSFVPTGNVAATTVQAAITELDSEKAALTTLAAAGGAALIGNSPAGNIAGTTVQAALNELDAEKAALTALAASGGSALIGFIQSETGSVARTMEDKSYDFVSVFDFMTTAQKADVKAGTATLDVVGAFTTAVATGRPVFVPHGPGWKYKFGSTLSVPSNTTLFSHGAKIVLAAAVNNHVMRIANAADNVEVTGFEIDGVKASNTGGSGIAMGGTGGTRIRIRNNYVHDCSAHGIYTGGTTVSGIDVSGNYCYNNYSGGITGDDTTTYFAYQRNFCWNNGTHGVGLLGIGRHGSIVGNVCWDNGQGSPTADNLTGYSISNYDVTITGNISSGGVNNGQHWGGSKIVVSSNTAYDAAQNGILISPSSGSGDDVTVGFNVCYSNGLQGLRLVDCASGSLVGNVCRDNGTDGLGTSNCTDVSIGLNNCRGNTAHGINNGTASTYLTYSANTCRSNGGNGINLNDVTLSTLTGNSLRGNSNYGIGVAGTEGNNNIGHNTIRSNTVGQIQQPAATTRVSGNETGTSRTIASAGTMTLPPGGEYFYVTGTTSITSITASFAERRVTLQFDDALTVTDGSNLNLAGNFVTTWKDTITLICDGASWHECSRSVN